MKRFLALAVLTIGAVVATGTSADAHWRGGYGVGYRGGYSGGGCHSSSYYRPSYGVGYGAPVYSYPTYGYGTPYHSGFSGYGGGYGVPVYGSGFQVYSPGISIGVWR